MNDKKSGPRRNPRPKTGWEATIVPVVPEDAIGQLLDQLKSDEQRALRQRVDDKIKKGVPLNEDEIVFFAQHMHKYKAPFAEEADTCGIAPLQQTGIQKQINEMAEWAKTFGKKHDFQGWKSGKLTTAAKSHSQIAEDNLAGLRAFFDSPIPSGLSQEAGTEYLEKLEQWSNLNTKIDVDKGLYHHCITDALRHLNIQRIIKDPTIPRQQATADDGPSQFAHLRKNESPRIG